MRGLCGLPAVLGYSCDLYSPVGACSPIRFVYSIYSSVALQPRRAAILRGPAPRKDISELVRRKDKSATCERNPKSSPLSS